LISFSFFQLSCFPFILRVRHRKTNWKLSDCARLHDFRNPTYGCLTWGNIVDPWYPWVCGFQGDGAKIKGWMFRMHRVQYCTAFVWFIFPITSANFCWRPAIFQQISDFHFITSIKSIHSYLDLGSPFGFEEANFHRIKGRGTLNISHNIKQLMIVRDWLKMSLHPLNCVQFSFWIFFLILAVLEFELRALHLQVLYHLSHVPVLFVLVILEIGSYFLSRPAWTADDLFCTFWCSWNESCSPPSAAFCHWDAILQTPHHLTLLHTHPTPFPGIGDPPDSAFHITWMKVMCTQPLVETGSGKPLSWAGLIPLLSWSQSPK
jgi:hypothetical protein